MKTLKILLRHIALILMIALASIMPAPIPFYRKDDLPKHSIEHIDTNDDENEEDTIKALF